MSENKGKNDLRKDFQVPDSLTAGQLKNHLSKVALQLNEWGEEVLGRLDHINDLVASESVTHLRCETKVESGC